MHLILDQIRVRLDGLDRMMRLILRSQFMAEFEMSQIEDALADEQTAIAEQTTVIASVKLLLSSLEAKVRALPTEDPAATAAAIHTLADSIRAQSADLAAAVAAGTDNTSGDPATPDAPPLVPNPGTPAQVIPPSQGGVTTDPTGGVIVDPSIPSGTDVPTSIPATPGDPANPLPAGSVPPVTS